MNSIIFSFKNLLSITACSIGTKVKSNGFNANFVLATVYQVSDDRLIGASGCRSKQFLRNSSVVIYTYINFNIVQKGYAYSSDIITESNKDPFRARLLHLALHPDPFPRGLICSFDWNFKIIPMDDLHLVIYTRHKWVSYNKES